MSKKINGSLALADQSIYSASNIINLIMLGRYGSSNELGYYTLCFSLILFVINTHEAFLTMPYTITRTGRDSSNLHFYKNHVALIFLIFNCAILLVCIVVGVAMYVTGSAFISISLLWAFGLGIFFITARDFIRKMLFANFQFRTALGYDAFILIAQLIGFWWLVLHTQLTASVVIYLNAACCLLPALVWCCMQKNILLVHIPQLKMDLQTCWEMGKWLFSASVMMWLSRQLYPWLLVLVHGPQSAGIYAACWSFAQFSRPFLKGFGNYLVPTTSLVFQEKPHELEQNLKHIITITFAISLVPTLLLLCFGKEILILVYGSDFAKHASVVYTLSLYIPAMAVSYIFIVGFKSIKKPQKNFLINVLTFFISMICCYFLIGPYGPLGAAASLLIGELIGIGIRYSIFKTTLGIELTELQREFAKP